MASTWREYQDEASDFFRSLGFTATVDAVIEGARGRHQIDVLVESVYAGVSTRWIVECKHWKRSVPKEKVLTFQQIAQDVGADRAFVLSEKGFQSGAIRVARNTNTTLANLEDLRESATEFVLQARLTNIARRLAAVNEPVSDFMIGDDGRPESPPGTRFEDVLEIAADLFMVRIELPKVIAGNFPVTLPAQPGHDHHAHVTVRDLGEFVSRAEGILTSAEQRMHEQKNRADQARREISRLLEQLVIAVDDLLEKGEIALIRSPESDAARREALDCMRRVGDSADALHDIAGRRTVTELRKLMRLLIDTIYRYLAQPAIAAEDWRAACDNVAAQREALKRAM